ncbi:MAG: BON domain-containing protein [Myxococcaceae bacterium]|nr:BON domain-containing protein [Myxococcaceae bacterium]
MNPFTAILIATALTANPDSAPPDAWLTTKSKLTLLGKGELRSSQVHVDTTEGVVTLYGKVKSANQKKAAEKAVRELDGVRAVKNLLQVVPSAQEKTFARSDADIKDQAEKLLKEDPALKDSDLNVKSVDKGVVLLTGKVNTVSDRLRAVGDVDQIAGVNRVVAQLEGPDTYGDDEKNLTFAKEPRIEKRNSMTDTRITTEVKMKLLVAKGVPGTDINVDTRDGVVTLFGAVPTEEGKNRAETHAAGVNGVLRVKNQLELVPARKVKVVEARDEDITDALKKRFSANDAYDDVDFEVKNGAVRLTGTVATAWQKLQALRIARGTPGVNELHEELELKAREGGAQF